MGYLGWIIAAFLLGAATAVWIAWRLLYRRPLRERLNALGAIEGRDLSEISRQVRASPCAVRPYGGGRMLRTWRGEGYAITLLFDGQDFCLGVMEEQDRAADSVPTPGSAGRSSPQGSRTAKLNEQK